MGKLTKLRAADFCGAFVNCPVNWTGNRSFCAADGHFLPAAAFFAQS
jgi:hypothetical protein